MILDFNDFTQYKYNEFKKIIYDKAPEKSISGINYNSSSLSALPLNKSLAPSINILI